MSTTLFRMPGGRSIPMQRAIKMGLCDADGNALTPAADSQAAAVLRKDARAADWAKRQRTGEPVVRAQSRRRGPKAEPGAPETTPDGKMRRKREPKPLVPQNVTAEGEPITDEETLAEIAAKTAAIEAAKAAGETAAEATPATPAEPEPAAES